MEQILRRISDYLYDRNISIDVRLSYFFVAMGTLAGFCGALVTIITHSSPLSTVCIGLLIVSAPFILRIFSRSKQPQNAGYLIAIALMVLMPVIWMTTGGSEGGANFWFLYELFFISLFAPRKRLPFYLIPAIALQAMCDILQWARPQLVFHLASVRDQALSSVCSMVIVSLTIILTVYVQKRIYEHEKHFGDQREDTTLNFITSIANIIDAKDSYTGGHSKRVASCAMHIARSLGLDENTVDQIHLAGLLHDIGKIGVPDAVLNCPSRLTPNQFDMIRRHPIIGGEILKKIDFLPNVRESALYHHERWDGNGYPSGLKGEQIPFFSRIIGVADAYDAMATDRVYRKKLTTDKIIKEFIRCRGVQFDPHITDVFIGMLRNGFSIDNASIDTTPQERSIHSVVSQMMDNLLKNEPRPSVQILQKLRDEGSYEGSMTLDFNDFTRMHEYIRRVGTRLGCHFVLLMISLQPADNNADPQQLSIAMDNLGTAISHTVRTVDISTRYNDSSFLLILLNAAESDADQIVHRIKTSYLNISGDTETIISHQLLQ